MGGKRGGQGKEKDCIFHTFRRTEKKIYALISIGRGGGKGGGGRAKPIFTHTTSALEKKRYTALPTERGEERKKLSFETLGTQTT